MLPNSGRGILRASLDLLHVLARDLLLLGVFPRRHDAMGLLHCFLVDCVALSLKPELELGLPLARLLARSRLIDRMDRFARTRATGRLQHVLLLTLSSDRGD